MTDIKKKDLSIGKIIVFIIAIALPVFHMWTASFGVYPSHVLSGIHWALVGSFIVVAKPLKGVVGKIIDAVLLLANVFICIYQIILQDLFVENAGIYSQFDILVSIASVVVILCIASRMTGRILPIISIAFIAYALLGRYVPGMFRTTRFTLQRIAPYLFTAYDGMFGQTLTVSAQYIYLFVLFGALLELTGAGEFFVEISYALTHKLKGGPAQAAVYSSMLMGTINGSGAANVVTTGTFTIPLMKKVGFKPEFAGAVEAVASSGGQIMPPVMGAVAFLMSEMTGIPYGSIALAAFIPALLYYITLSISVFCIAYKIEVPDPDVSQMRKARVILKEGWLYLTPVVLLIAMLIMGYSAQRSAFFAILLTLVVGFIKNRSNMTWDNFYKALLSSVKGIAPIAAACILAGIVMGVINLTGLGLKISSIIEVISNGHLMIALVLSMLTSLFLGMGLPTSAAYMILAVLVAPALVNMGSSMMAAHMFILYFGALSTITPPVALSTFAAAGIAESSVWKTGVEAVKLACTGFVIPFVFVYNNELLWSGSALSILWAFATAVIGCAVVSFSLTGWMKTKLSIVGRIILFPAGVMLFCAHPVWLNFLGVAIAAVVLLIENGVHKKKNNIAEVR